ncbi:MAG: hypothetical protein ACJ8GN_21265 [Longimicrobiaceae bacterium]
MPTSYRLSVRQGADGSLEPLSPPPFPLELHTATDPFAFTIRGPTEGIWCSNAEVEFADGTVVRSGEFGTFEPATRSEGMDIFVIVIGYHGANQVNSLVRLPGHCSL